MRLFMEIELVRQVDTKIMSKSQFGQDVHVLHTIYKGKRNGYFIEVGAYDGIESSNTYLLEKEYGWTGICVECSPQKYELLCKHRSSINIPFALYNTNGETMEFFDCGGYSGLVATNKHAHITNSRKLHVQTKKLTTLLEEVNAPSFIEYLSIDTEGSEFTILEAHDFEKFTFGYITVEHNRVEENRKKLRTLLESKGYVFYRENGDSQWGVIEDDYIHSSLLRNTT